MPLMDYLNRKKEVIKESMKDGQVGVIDQDRNQVTGLTFSDVNNTYQVGKIYEDELGNHFFIKVLESVPTQQTSDIKNPDLNIVKDKNGKDVALQRTYFKESASPYDVQNEENEFEQYESYEFGSHDEIQETLDYIEENKVDEPVFSEEEEAELKEAEEVLKENDWLDQYRAYDTTNPAPDANQNNHGINNVTKLGIMGIDTSIYESDEHAELVEFVINAVAEATTNMAIDESEDKPDENEDK